VVVLATARSSNQAKPSATWRSIYSSEGLAPGAVLWTAEQSRAPGRRRSLSHSHLAQLSKSHDQIKSKLTATAAVVWTATDCFGLVVGGSAGVLARTLHSIRTTGGPNGGGGKTLFIRYCSNHPTLSILDQTAEREEKLKRLFPSIFTPKSEDTSPTTGRV
jgi:hypothetical protein